MNPRNRLVIALCSPLFFLTFSPQQVSSQSHLIWSDVQIGQIVRANPDGSDAEVILARHLPAYHVVDFEFERVYWTDTGTRSVHSIAFDGSDETVFISGLTEPQGIDITEEGEFIIVDHKRILKYDRSGNQLGTIVKNLNDPTDVVAYDDFIYWGDKGESAIFRASIQGNFPYRLIENVYVLVDIEVRASTNELYWTQSPGVPGSSGIFKAKTNGIGKTLVHQGFINGIAIDEFTEEIYWSQSVDGMVHRASLGHMADDVTLITEGLNKPISLKIDRESGRLFILDVQDRNFLFEAKLTDGSGLSPIASSSVNRPTRFEIDTANNHIYWVNSKSPNSNMNSAAIMRADLDGKNARQLIGSNNLDDPFGLALDLDAGKIYWTDRGKRSISSASLTGTNIREVVTSGLLSPTGIAFDTVHRRLYWCDAIAGKIQSSAPDGSDLQDILTGLKHPYEVCLDTSGNSIYFTDHHDGLIGRYDLNGETYKAIATTPNPTTGRPNSLYVDNRDNKVYFTVDHLDDMIMRVNIDGSDLEQINVPHSNSPHDIYIMHPVIVNDDGEEEEEEEEEENDDLILTPDSTLLPPFNPLAEHGDTLTQYDDIQINNINRAVAFPNPFSHGINISTEHLILKAMLLDGNGRLIYVQRPNGLNQMQIKTPPDLPPGVYQLLILYQDGMHETLRTVHMTN